MVLLQHPWYVQIGSTWVSHNKNNLFIITIRFFVCIYDSFKRFGQESKIPVGEIPSDVNEATTLQGRGRDPRGRGQGRDQVFQPRGRSRIRGQVHEVAEVWKTEKFVMVH